MNDQELLHLLFGWRDRDAGLPTFDRLHNEVWRIALHAKGIRMTRKDTLEILERLKAKRLVVQDGDTWRAIPQPLVQKIQKQTQSTLF